MFGIVGVLLTVVVILIGLTSVGLLGQSLLNNARATCITAADNCKKSKWDKPCEDNAWNEFFASCKHWETKCKPFHVFTDWCCHNYINCEGPPCLCELWDLHCDHIDPAACQPKPIEMY